MNKIKILTVGEESYQITDPEAAHLSDGQISEETVWSAKYLIDRLCPAFTESGAVVACEPVEGYPLTVEANDVFNRCGKNIFDPGAEIAQRTYGNTTRWGYLVDLPAGTYTVHLEHIGEVSSNYVYAYHYDADGASKGSAQLSNGTALKTWTFTRAEGDKIYIVHGKDQSQTAAENVFAKYNIQIEVGSVATAYEPYQCESFVPGDTVPALPGVNTFWADSGNITVTGREDPTAIKVKLEARLAELEAALINV